MARMIPRGWTEVEVKDFLKFTPREVEKPKERYFSLGIRSHFKGTFIREVENPDKVMMESLYEVKKDDLIVNITFAWEGAVALVKKSDEGALVSHRFPTYVFDRKVVIPEFFRYLIPSKRLAYNLVVISPGGAGRNRVLDRNDFLELQFIMPPVPEQEKIAKILSTWDRAIEVLSKLIEATIHRKKDIANKLLSLGMNRGSLKKSAVGMIPNSWVVEKLGKLCIDKPNYGANASASDYRSDLPRYVRITDVLENGTLSMENLRSLKRDRAKTCILSEGDVVFARTGATVGKTYLYNKNDGECAFAGYLIRFKPDRKKLSPEFLFQVTHSERYHQWVKSILRAGAQPNINGAEYSNFLIAVPTLPEQIKIVTVLSTLDREIMLLTSVSKDFKEQRKGIMQKLLTGKIRVRV